MLTLPKDGSDEPATFRSLLSGLWQAMPKGALEHAFDSQGHISLKLVGHADRVQFQIWVPDATLARITLAQLRGHCPDVGVTRTHPLPLDADAIAYTELFLGLERDRPLRGVHRGEGDPMRGLLAGLADLAAHAWGLLAVLVRPLPCPALETLCFEAIIRLAAGGLSPEAARAHLRELAAGFGAFGAENTLRPGRVRRDAP
ncbi:MAG: hypothetical protein GX657_00085, partial [Chloroflexi bacterium]|nr:hypothetical protein [Chloroflexota bacterium]